MLSYQSRIRQEFRILVSQNAPSVRRFNWEARAASGKQHKSAQMGNETFLTCVTLLSHLMKALLIK